MKQQMINHTWNITSKRHNIFPTRSSILISSAGKIDSVQKCSSSCFIAGDSHMKLIWLLTVVFIEHYILHL